MVFSFERYKGAAATQLKKQGEGGGGGGAVRTVPVGVIEVSKQQTRFVPITDRKKMTGALLAGIGFGMWLASARIR